MSDPISKISGKNIIEHLRLVSNITQETGRYFYFDSALMRAIQNEISENPDSGILEDWAYGDAPKPNTVVHGRAHSGVHFKDAHLFAPKSWSPLVESETFCIEIEVDFGFYNEDEGEHREESRKFRVYPPTELAIQFDQKKFDKWVKELTKKRDEERRKKDLDKLRRLINTYPARAREILGNKGKK